jgi:hypothetical protein
MILAGMNKGQEEAKDDNKNSKRARTIIEGLEPKSKVDTRKDFRAFLKS